MRSVIRKPPVTLIMAEVTAAHPRTDASIACGPSCLAPAMTNEPISEMPEIALVADISGVCSSGGTREINWYPRNAARAKTYSDVIKTRVSEFVVEPPSAPPPGCTNMNTETMRAIGSNVNRFIQFSLVALKPPDSLLLPPLSDEHCRRCKQCTRPSVSRRPYRFLGRPCPRSIRGSWSDCVSKADWHGMEPLPEDSVDRVCSRRSHPRSHPAWSRRSCRRCSRRDHRSPIPAAYS